MRRALHAGWILLTVLVLAALGTLYYLGWTEPGLQTLASRLSRQIGPVTMSIRNVSGTLAHGAHIGDFVLDHRRTHIEASAISARLSMPALLRMVIDFEEASIGKVLVRVIPQGRENSNWEPHFLRAPLSLQLPQVRIAEAALIATSGRRWDFTALDSSGSVYPYTIRFTRVLGTYSGIAMQGEGEVLAAKPIGLQGKFHFRTQPEGQPLWNADATFAGNLDKLSITGAISEPLAADFSGAALELNKAWRWEGDAQVRKVDLRAWGAGNALGVITGKLALSGDRNGFQARGELTPPGLAAGPLQTEFRGSYADRVLSASLLRLVHRPSGSTLVANGTIGVVGQGPRLALNGGWSNLRWPLADQAAPVHSNGGAFTLRGLWPYELRASGRFRIQELPDMTFTGEGSLARDRLVLRQTRVQAWDGEAELTGEAQWSPEERWQLAGNMRGFNVERARPGVRGLLSFRVSASGEGFGKGGSLRGEIDNVGGQVRGQRASGHGRAALSGEDWLLSDVRLQLGGSRINIDGRIGSQYDVKFAVDSDDLALLKADARGRLHAVGEARGGAGQLMLQLEASGSDIAWDEIRARALTARAALDDADSGRADVNLKVSGLQLGARILDSLDFTTTGTRAAHQVNLDARAPQLQVHATGTGQLAGSAWQWRMQQARVADGRDLLMNLEQPAQLELAADRQQLSQFCLRGMQARLCGSGSAVRGARALSISADMLPLRALTAGLVAETEFNGTLSVEAHGNAAPGEAWRGALRSQLVDAAIRHRFRSGRADTFSLGTGAVDLQLATGQLTGTVALNAGAAGRIAGSITAHRAGDGWQGWPLSGGLRVESDAFDLLDSYLAVIDRASGRVTADLRLAGTLGQPELNGALQVRDARIDAYQVNQTWRDINLDAEFNENVLSLSGTASAGVDGKASVSGTLRQEQGQLYGKLHLEGDNLLLVNIFEAKVYASPKLDFAIAARRIDVTGTVDLPYAKLEQPEELATAVRASSDEIAVGEKPVDDSATFRQYYNVTLRLGDRVTINTNGLQGRLSGALNVISNESGITLGSGELAIEEGGKYTALGRKLEIERGRLLYQNSPPGNPGVDLRATKKFPEITAGVNVRGTLTAPRMTFFSDPIVPQQQIVSVLLAGGSIQSLQTTNNADTRGNEARTNMLLQGSAILAQQFGNRLGTDVSVESNLQNDTSLVLGRYLSPRLYLSYGISIAEAINTIKLNYSISDRWAIRTEAGQNRSADLVYTLRR